ncbi:Glutamyl-tRNA reductase [Fimbriiglobus ruber]|uniref:Glutamyl-tRNA reductase n=1 Tax=Fimbriiglobus ruber TaxID=1908690 RepID=A0A225DFH2_9BACT|nr:Glutamyl-tRNA reductase [Fimbriiglobus ruber]
MIGCNFRTAPVELRERLAFDDAKRTKAVTELAARYGVETVLISTCNRVELYVARPGGELAFNAGLAAEFLAEVHGVPVEAVSPLLYEHSAALSVRHLFRVAASLDSLIVGEGQIVGQVKQAFQDALQLGATGPLLNAAFQHALRVAGRVRTETGISKGHVSVSSVAVDYVKQVFDHFTDKTVLIIGAGKMGRLTLKHLQALNPGRILVTNRSPQKAVEVAAGCGGTAVPWDDLDHALIAADIVISTTGAPEPIMPRARYVDRVLPKRVGTQVILDIAVPRDFDPAIHDGDRVCLFNIDDLVRVREQTIAKRQRFVQPAEVIVEQEVKKFVEDWNRRRNGPVIGQMTAGADKMRSEIVTSLLTKLNGKLTPGDKDYIEGAFRLFQNKLLHGPKAALEEASRQGHGGAMLEAVKKLFWLKE